MAGEVVGTAYVRIKALTDQLAKEIEKGIKKGMKDAKLDKVGREGGDEVGESFGDGFVDSSNKTIGKRSKDIVPDDVFKDLRQQVERLDLDKPFRDKFDGLPFDKLNRQINDNSTLSKSLDRLDAKFKGLGKGGGFHIGLLRGALLGIGGAIVASLPFIQDAGSAILAYATGLVAQIGFLTTAVGGLGVAAAAALGSAAVAAIPIALAFQSQTTFLKDFTDSISATGEEFTRIGTVTQQTLLPALDEAAFVLGDLIPMLSEFGLFVGHIVGGYAHFAAATLVGNEAQGRFSEILRSSLNILDQLFPTLINIGNILSGIWVAAIPASERFARTIRSLTDRWAEMVVAGLETGELTSQFDIWYDRAQTLGSALGDLTGALFDILEVGGNQSSSLFDRFDDWAERFRAFTESESGQNKLALIFENSLAVMRELNGIVADLFDGIFGRLADVGGVDNMVAALQRFRDVIPEIQEFWDNAMVTIDRVVRLFASAVWEKITRAWEEMAEPLGRLGEQLLDFLAVMNESGAFDVFLDLMRILSDTLATLLSIPGFGTFVAYFLAFGAAIKVASFALSPFLRLFSVFGTLITNLIRQRAGLAMAGMAGGLQKLAAGFKAAGAAGAIGSFTKAMQAGSVATAGKTGVGGFVGALGGAARALGPALMGPLGIAAGAALIGGGLFLKAKHDAQVWAQEIRQATESIGLLNDGLNITAGGIANYVKEASRFKSRDQIDDLLDMGLTVEALSAQLANGTGSLRKFVDTAVQTDQLRIEVGLTGISESEVARGASSLGDLQRAYRLTNEDINNLIEGQEIFATDGTSLTLQGNKSLIASYKELSKVIGEAAKENIDEFATNATNIRLLGEEALVDIRNGIVNNDDSVDVAQRMRGAMEDLGVAAQKDSAAITGLSDATRSLVREQIAGLRGPERAIKENELLTAALAKQNDQIRENLVLFTSDDFAEGARNAVVGFVDVINNADFTGFNIDDDLDGMVEKFPFVAGAAHNLFTQLSQLPEDQFHAAATAMGVDADGLRTAMEGAMGAIKDLQDQAVASLPSVGQLLDDATSVDDKGTQSFDRKGFVKSMQQRIEDTKAFSTNIAYIKEKSGEEAARLAAQEGPEAAKNLAEMVGTSGDQLNATLKSMEASEDALRKQISDVLGPGIALEFAEQAGLVGNNWGTGLAAGLGSAETVEALRESGLATLNVLQSGFQGQFVWEGDKLKFIPTGSFPNTGTKRRTADNSRFGFSSGGFVGDTLFGGGPRGTDTIPAWLTKGEFVIRRAVAQSIPASTLNALNAGDPRVLGLLSSINRNRPGSANNPVVTSTATPAARQVSGGITIGQMNIEAPTPLESARQTTDRLRIMQTQLQAQ